MDNLGLTLIIVLGVLGFVILMISLKRRKIKDAALVEYCNDKGYSYNKTKEQSLSTITITGDDFILKSTMAAQQNPASDETGWESNTRWTLTKTDTRRPAFALGSIPSNTDWDSLPDMVKKMAIQKLMSESGLVLDPDEAQLIDTTGKSTFLLFEESPGKSYETVQRLRPFLSQWSDKQIIFIKSSPDKISLNITDYFIKNVDSLKKVFELTDNISQ